MVKILDFVLILVGGGGKYDEIYGYVVLLERVVFLFSNDNSLDKISFKLLESEIFR